jgi:hypothetical protein
MFILGKKSSYFHSSNGFLTRKVISAILGSYLAHLIISRPIPPVAPINPSLSFLGTNDSTIIFLYLKINNIFILKILLYNSLPKF